MSGLVGAGIQGPSDFEQLDKVFDAYIVLESDIGFCQGLGPRAWLRILNDGDRWREPIAWAKYCVDKMAEVYQYGTRVLIPQNECNLALEGGGDTEADYIFLGEWWKAFLPETHRLLYEHHMDDVEIAGPFLSPGHQETDGGGYNKHLLPCYYGVDRIGVHCYHYPGGGFLNDPDAIHWSRRIEQDMAYLKSLGVPDKPWCIGEFNREVDIHSESDRNNAVEQIKQYYDYMPEVDKFYFLATNTDKAFNKLSLAYMPGSIDKLAEWKANRQPQPEVPTMPVKTAKIGNLEVIDLRSEMPDNFPTVPYQVKDFISIHHSVTPKNTTPQTIYEYHKTKYGGIGYNFLVDDWGAIFYVGECNTSRAAVGAISQGNRRGVHTCIIGDYSTEKPSQAALGATKRLVANLQHAYGWFMPVVPHRLFNNDTHYDTECPGGSYRLWWHEILRAVGD